ncbi:Rieske 2Fe-2S domain-containing protein [Aerosakkonema funiforme]|uniref:Rieske 2Fe-2S domain-containing protein n=1 Tax=Aerosakkonema funiforme TaxID=1246630 RepID=UPI0035BB1FF1
MIEDPILLNDWHVVAKVEDCPPGKIFTARLLGEDLILWRPKDPNSPIQVWQDYCPHRGARLSLGEVCDRTLVCAYHGWEYDTAGKCKYIPAHPNQEPLEKAQIKTYQCQERYGWVWVCLGSPSGDVPTFPIWDDPNCAKLWCGPLNCNASGFRLMESFVDIAHVPFVHRHSLGPSNPQIEDYEVVVTTEEISIPERMFQMDSDGKQTIEVATSLTKVSSLLTVSVFTETKQGPSPGRTAWLAAITPVEEEKCLLWTCAAIDLDSSLVPQWGKMHERLLWEDIRIVNSQRPARLPLGPATDSQWPANLHVPSDRCTVIYRKWLKDKGVTFGVC